MCSKNESRQRLITFTFAYTIQYPRTLNNNICHSNKPEPPPFFSFGPILGHVLAHLVDKTHVLVVTVELIWLLFLNRFFLNFVPTPNKSLRFTRFRRSYVNRTAVVLTNQCQSYTAFLLDVRCSKWPRSFFCSFLRKTFLVSTSVSRMLLTPRWVSRRKDVK